MALRRFSLLLAAVAFGGCSSQAGVGDKTSGTGGHGGASGPSSSSSSAGSGGGAATTSASASSGGGGAATTSSSAGGGGAATTSSSATTGASSSSGAGSGGGASSSSGGPVCAPPCGANELCDAPTSTCLCSPGYMDVGNSCVAALPGDPTLHTQQQVCDNWTQGHVVTDPVPFSANGACNPGVLSPASILDTLTRINMFRWMVGLGATADDAALDVDAQQCANLEAWWPFMGGDPTMPPPNSMCYTAQGAAAAALSSIGWGVGSPAQAIDIWIEDQGVAGTMQDRRRILNPPLDPVGIGFWQKGGKFGNVECLQMAGANGNGPNPPWIAMPPPGFVEFTLTNWTWTFHTSIAGVANAHISMLLVDTDTPLAVTVTPLASGFALNAISWTPNGWAPLIGKTYRVTVSGLANGDVTYEVKPVACN